MNLHYDFDDIDDYVHDRMSASDRAAFEQALETDAELARRVEALRAEDKVLRMLRDEHLLAQFEAWDRAAAHEKKSGDGSGGAKLLFFPHNWMVPAAAAAVIGIVVASIAFDWFGWNNPSPGMTQTQPVLPDTPSTMPPAQQAPPDPEAIAVEQPPAPPAPQAVPKTPSSDYYAQLSEKYHAGDRAFDETLMGGSGDNGKSRYKQAVELYEARRYREAVTLLEKPDSARLQPYLFLRAHTYYRLGRYQSALRDFRAFQQYQTSDYAYEAQWGEVLCLLRQMPATEAALRTLLQPMEADSDHPYHQQATDLLQDLKQ